MKLNNISRLPDKKKWINNFIKSDKFEQICQEVDNFDLKKRIFFDEEEVKPKFKLPITPRELNLLEKKINIQPFYILDFISSQSDKVIYDIGCGVNFFKKFYNLIGIDPINRKSDIKDKFDSNFLKKHTEDFYNAITINAIHFCSLFDIEKQIYEFISLVKHNGFVYIALNCKRMIEFCNEQEIKNLNTSIEEYIDNIVKKIPYEIFFYENTINKFPDEGLNGNIKILIKKTNKVINGTDDNSTIQTEV